MEEYKQVIIVRDDLKLSKGKLAAQVAHAAILGYEKAGKENLKRWKDQAQKKVVLRVPTLEDVLKLEIDAKKLGLPTGIVKDAGLTEIPPGTITALVIGPAPSKLIDKITRDLPLLK
jgi:PTH2 family peptidyl-tRNA hydrolase